MIQSIGLKFRMDDVYSTMAKAILRKIHIRIYLSRKIANIYEFNVKNNLINCTLAYFKHIICPQYAKEFMSKIVGFESNVFPILFALVDQLLITYSQPHFYLFKKIKFSVLNLYNYIIGIGMVEGWILIKPAELEIDEIIHNILYSLMQFHRVYYYNLSVNTNIHIYLNFIKIYLIDFFSIRIRKSLNKMVYGQVHYNGFSRERIKPTKKMLARRNKKFKKKRK